MRPRNATEADVALDYPEHLRRFHPRTWVVGDDWLDGAVAWYAARRAWRQARPAYIAAQREQSTRDYFDNLRKDSK